MAYNRRTSASYRSDEDAHLTSPTTAGPLSPPRPYFAAARGQGSDRGSVSSADGGVDGSDSDREPIQVAQRGPRGKQSRRRSQIVQQQQQQAVAYSPTTEEGASSIGHAGGRDPFSDRTGAASSQGHDAVGWSPTSLYEDAQGGPQAPRATRAAPPSAFAFPFQAYPGNPDPGTTIPGMSRRSSGESLRRPPSGGAGQGAEYAHYAHASGGYDTLAQGSPSATDLSRPYAPFMAGGGGAEGGSRGASPAHSRRSSFTSASGVGGAVYANSAAAGMSNPNLVASGASAHYELPRSASTATFRAPFLSPASRPTSSVWAPPPFAYGSPSGTGSVLGLNAMKSKPPMASNRLAAKLTKDEKPWLADKDGAGRLSWWITFILIVLGFGAAAAICWDGYRGTKLLGKTCEIYNLKSGNFGDDWHRDVGRGDAFDHPKGGFEYMTSSNEQLQFDGNEMVFTPTLTNTDYNQNLNGGRINDDGCTLKDTNSSACDITASTDNGEVLPPVKSARVRLDSKFAIAFGYVEIEAKLPRGDWLWPGIRMYPVDNTYYGYGLASGEINFLEARGNGPEYPNGGNNVVRSTLNYGPLTTLVKSIFGWQEFKHQTLADGYHKYGMEWDQNFMRFYVDSRLHVMLQLDTKKESFTKRGKFPKTAHNGTAGDTEVVVPDVYNTSNSAPFDRPFSLAIDLAVGGTSGWFPDQVGGKPWQDNTQSAVKDFVVAQNDWSKTWNGDKSFRIRKISVQKLGGC